MSCDSSDNLHARNPSNQTHADVVQTPLLCVCIQDTRHARLATLYAMTRARKAANYSAQCEIRCVNRVPPCSTIACAWNDTREHNLLARMTCCGSIRNDLQSMSPSSSNSTVSTTSPIGDFDSTRKHASPILTLVTGCAGF